MEKGLLGGIILGAGLVAGGLAVVWAFKQAGYYPLRLAGSYQNDWVHTPSTGDPISIDSGSQHFLANTIPPIDPMMTAADDDWMVRNRYGGARFYS